MPQQSSYLALAARFKSGETSPSKELEARLARLDALEPTLKAFVHVARDAARKAAAASDQRWKSGQPLSAIDGMAIGIKDIIETIDMPTGQGSPLWEGFETRRDAASVQGLRAAGAVILGKTTTTEFAASYTFAPTTNPHDATRTPGGSSSGSAAAVGAGILPAALGTQVVGSILRPASFCGAVGYKPTFGALNRGGSYDYLSQSSLGVLAATPSDAWIVARTIAARVGGDPGFVGLQGPLTPPAPKAPKKLAVLQTAAWSGITAGAKAAFDGVKTRLAALGVSLTDRSADPEIEALEQSVADSRNLTLAMNAWEGAWPLGTYRARDAAKLSKPVIERIEQGLAMTQDDYRKLLDGRQEARKRHAAVGARYDGIVTLSASGGAPVGLGFTGDTGMIVPGSYLGGPAITLPLLKDGHMPLGLQLLGLPDRDAELFALAEWAWQSIEPA